MRSSNSGIREGSRVEARDGTLGAVQRLERDADGAPLHLRVREEDGVRFAIVPVGLVRAVDDDGTVRLSATLDEARTFTPRPAPDALARRPEPPPAAGPEVSVPLRREELTARVEARELGSVVVGTEVDEVPGRVEVEAVRDEIELVHVPVGRVADQRVDPWWEDGELVIPLYEERLTVNRELVLKEKLHVRRIAVVERRAFEETLRQERLVIADPERTEVLRESERDGVLEALRAAARGWLARVRRRDGAGL